MALVFQFGPVSFRVSSIYDEDLRTEEMLIYGKIAYEKMNTILVITKGKWEMQHNFHLSFLVVRFISSLFPNCTKTSINGIVCACLICNFVSNFQQNSSAFKNRLLQP